MNGFRTAMRHRGSADRQRVADTLAEVREARERAAMARLDSQHQKIRELQREFRLAQVIEQRSLESFRLADQAYRDRLLSGRARIDILKEMSRFVIKLRALCQQARDARQLQAQRLHQAIEQRQRLVMALSRASAKRAQSQDLALAARHLTRNRRELAEEADLPRPRGP